jgi:CHAD domain-containing protein
VELLTQLGARRAKAAAELHTVIFAHQEQARYLLKRCSRGIQDRIDAAAEEPPPRLFANVTAQSLRLTGELEAWPTLTAKNLHPYRLKVKELRYVLQLGEDDEAFIDSLTEVKDRIGAWHDWSVLASIAEELLDHDAGAVLLAQIRSKIRQEFKKAITASGTMQRNYLDGAAPRKGTRKPPQTQRTPPAVMKTAARLAG